MHENDRIVVHSSSSALWRTPPKLFAKLHVEAEFHVDLAADATSSLLGGDYFGLDHVEAWRRNGLAVPWGATYRHGFFNPPFSRDAGLPIEPWVRKAYQESLLCGFTSFGLIPVRTSTKWWNDWVMVADEIRTIPHRVKFLYPDGSEGTSAPFDSCVAVWRPRGGRPSSTPPRFFPWDYL